MTLQPGNTLGNYQIVEKIGAGGMGAVYKAYQPGLGRYVAIKVLPPQTAGDPAFAERFAQEARAIGKLRHPNIVTAFDFTQQGDFAYLVSDYIDGGTLADQLGTPLPLDYALGIVGPIAGALDYAHSRGIVHRDIKPQNVLLTREGTPVLTDFGLAKIVGPGSGMTQVGSLMGTADYMAPELAGGAEAAGPAADQYALAIIAYQMLVGRHPFPADNPLSALMAHVHKPVPIPSQLGVVLPPGAEAALLRALSKKPGDRFARAADFVRALAGSQYAVPASAATLAALAAPTATTPSQPPVPAPTPAEAMAVSPLVSASGLVGPVARVEPPAGPAILAPAAVAGSAATAVMVAPKKRGGFPWRRALVPGILVLVLAVLSLRGGSDLNAGIDRLDPAQPTAPRATLPVVAPTATPMVPPTATPSAAPTPTPTTASTTSPTPAPTARPSVTPTVAPSAVDAGHTPATVTTIAPGTYRGTIAPAGEVDFFRVNVPTNTFIAVDLRADTLPNGGVAIFNASGTEVAAEVTTGADHLARVTHMAREAGYYIIRVRGTRADLTGTYTLTYASTAR